jgi:hypothetical protein
MNFILVFTVMGINVVIDYGAVMTRTGMTIHKTYT